MGSIPSTNGHCHADTDTSDKIHEGICAKLGVTTQQLQLAQVLEASTWKGGREIAKAKRPATGGRE